jgi:hypothetical protein
MVQSINALSAAPRVGGWLANSRDPRILHIFDDVCNLINEREEVLSIVTPRIGNGPFNLVIADDLCFSDSLQVESQVFRSPDQLMIGEVIIHLLSAKLWNSRPDWTRLYSHRENIARCLMELRANNQFSHSLALDLSSALAAANFCSAKIIASKLAGLGIGLTPSGDDFIMGAIYAAWIIHPPKIAAPLVQGIVNTAAPLTTSLSAAWLRSAGEGEAGNVWHEFLDALVSENALRIEERMNNILAVGETSGADALAGLTSVFMSWMEKGGFSHG